MNLADARKLYRKGDAQPLLQLVPHARFLRISVDLSESEPVTVLPFRNELVGNPTLPAVHGGVVSTVLELGAALHLLWVGDGLGLPKAITHSVDYLRSAGPREIRVWATVRRRGRRVVNVETQAWQDEKTRLVAVGHGHFLFPSASL